MAQSDECLVFDDPSLQGLDLSGNTKGEGGFVCVSGGKDSVAMVLRMLELNDPVNYPVSAMGFADTEFEFDELYDYLKFIDFYIQEHYPDAPKLEMLKPLKTWEDWFYGEITRGNNKGKVRGAPLRVYPCWWSRHSKLEPLQRAAKSHRWSFVGIAADEAHRVQKQDPTKIARMQIRYPLIEWGWTENDCMEYLSHLGIGNQLYLSFNRIGCYHCIKQPISSWYQVWKDWPDKFAESIEWDKESMRVSNHGLRMDYTLEELQERFEGGYVPEARLGVNDCETCDAVSFFSTGNMDLEDFDDDDAIERDPRFEDSPANEGETITEWIPPSHRAPKAEWL